MSPILARQFVWTGKESLKERSLQRRTASRQGISQRDAARAAGRAEADLIPSIEAELLDLVDSAVVLVDLDGVINFWSAGAERLYGWSRAAAVDRRIDTLLKTEFLTPNEVIAASLEEQGAWSGELIDTARDGRRIRVHSRQAVRRGADGQADGVLETNTDISMLASAQDRAVTMTALVETAEDAVMATDRNGVVVEWNPACERLYGFTIDEAVGCNAIDLVASSDEDSVKQRAIEAEVLAGMTKRSVDQVDRKRNGDEIAVEVSISPIFGREGDVVGIARVARDITLRKELEARLRELADSDPLTGLWNRRRMEIELASRIEAFHRYGQQGSLITFDLDDFKSINDNHGHPAGDAYLESLAGLLTGQSRKGDLLFRVGGDEFAMLVAGSGDGPGLHVAAWIREAVAGHVVRFEDAVLRSAASIGVADLSLTLAPDTSGDHVLPGNWSEGAAACLASGADIAMYKAKESGGNAVMVATPEGTAVKPADPAGAS